MNEEDRKGLNTFLAWCWLLGIVWSVFNNNPAAFAVLIGAAIISMDLEELKKR